MWVGSGGKCGLRCGWVVEVNVEVRCGWVGSGGEVHDEQSDPTCMTCSIDTDSCVTYSKHGFYKLHAAGDPCSCVQLIKAIDSHTFARVRLMVDCVHSD